MRIALCSGCAWLNYAGTPRQDAVASAVNSRVRAIHGHHAGRLVWRMGRRAHRMAAGILSLDGCGDLLYRCAHRRVSQSEDGAAAPEEARGAYQELNPLALLRNIVRAVLFFLRDAVDALCVAAGICVRALWAQLDPKRLDGHNFSAVEFRRRGAARRMAWRFGGAA